ncbi:MAG: diacylglycerol kinase family lipid kinase [Bacteroidetes bacterium]|nr:MAG: diacylglycerol kinase family lipid kinase [Bacteroidota bacterium]
MNKKILYIINPISGTKKNKNIEKIIDYETDKNQFELSIKYTKYPGHGSELSEWAVKNKYNVVIAVGGDGTVNEVSSALINTDIIFGIIPKGSGNGLARFLKIPINKSNAVQLINQMNVFKMDSILLNNFHYVNMAGIGFDAHIAHLFANYGKRGFKSYVELIFREFKKFESKYYNLVIDGKTINEQAFLISFANSSQFGNEAHIAPLAKINDGLIDVCILNRFPKYKVIGIIYQLYTKRLLKSKYYKVYKAKQIELKSEHELKGHIDGDPVNFGSKLNIKILPQSLNVISGRNF